MKMPDCTGWAASSLPAKQPLLDRFRALGGDPDVLRPVVEVTPDCLEALAEMRETFGTIEAYFAEGLNVDRRLRRLLSPPSSRAAGRRGHG